MKRLARKTHVPVEKHGGKSDDALMGMPTFAEEDWERNGMNIVTNRGVIAIVPTPQDGGVFDCDHNATLLTATPIGYLLARAVCDQADDGLDRSAYIHARAIEFMRKAKGK